MDEQAPPGRLAARVLFSPVTAAIVTMLLWSVTTIVVRYVRGEMPPLGLSFWRTFLAFLILLPFAIRPLRRQWDLVPSNPTATRFPLKSERLPMEADLRTTTCQVSP